MKDVGEEIHPKDLPETDCDWIIYPQLMYYQLKSVYDDYPIVHSIYITENVMGYKDKFESEDKIIDDTPRIDYLRQHTEEVAKAIEAGIPVNGYFVWSRQDMFSWTNGYSKCYGLFYVDFKTQKCYAKKSVYWYKKLAEIREISPID